MATDNELDSLQAKVVVLGDPRTGKSSIVRSLDPYCRSVSQTGSSGEQTSFTVIEIPSNELDAAVANVYLKFWEYTGAGKKEQEVAFPGALFCIITLDMRAPETANSAFNKWIALKEAHMPESFLFVVGTFLDFAAQRRVEIADICKACAQKEAIYIEVSNMDGSNITLLRRLICQRLNQMLKIREEQKRLAATAASRGEPSNTAQEGKQDVEGGAYSDESKSAPVDLILDSLSPAILERHILGNSVGNILASTLNSSVVSGLDEQWQGFDAEQQNLSHVGKRISSFIDQLSQGGRLSLPEDAPPPPPPVNRGTHLSEPDSEEIRHLFDMMGLPLPASLRVGHDEGDNGKNRVSVKLKVRLPDNSFAHLVLRSGDDIERMVHHFAAGHGMLDKGSVSRLVDVGTRMLRRAEAENDSGQHDTGASSKPVISPGEKSVGSNASPRKPRRCKARIQLPNNQVLETVVTRGEDAMVIARRLSEEHGLSMGFQHKIWEQLQLALDSLERSGSNSVKRN